MKAETVTKRPVRVPPIWFDNVQILARHDVPVAVIVFDAVFPETNEIQEVARLTTTVEHLRRIKDSIEGLLARRAEKQDVNRD